MTDDATYWSVEADGTDLCARAFCRHIRDLHAQDGLCKVATCICTGFFEGEPNRD